MSFFDVDLEFEPGHFCCFYKAWQTYLCQFSSVKAFGIFFYFCEKHESSGLHFQRISHIHNDDRSVHKVLGQNILVWISSCTSQARVKFWKEWLTESLSAFQSLKKKYSKVRWLSMEIKVDRHNRLLLQTARAANLDVVTVSLQRLGEMWLKITVLFNGKVTDLRFLKPRWLQNTSGALKSRWGILALRAGSGRPSRAASAVLNSNDTDESHFFVYV